jgi:hypothetical protein
LNLDPQDLATVRDIYAQAHHWARHYETLVVSTNVLLVSASMVIVSVVFRDAHTFARSAILLVVPILMSAVGFALTGLLFRMYSQTIERLIRIENLLDCYDPARFHAIDGKGPLLPLLLGTLPVRRPITVLFFYYLHGSLIALYGLLAPFVDI